MLLDIAETWSEAYAVYGANIWRKFPYKMQFPLQTTFLPLVNERPTSQPSPPDSDIFCDGDKDLACMSLALPFQGHTVRENVCYLHLMISGIPHCKNIFLLFLLDLIFLPGLQLSVMCPAMCLCCQPFSWRCQLRYFYISPNLHCDQQLWEKVQSGQDRADTVSPFCGLAPTKVHSQWANFPLWAAQRLMDAEMSQLCQRCSSGSSIRHLKLSYDTQTSRAITF